MPDPLVDRPTKAELYIAAMNRHTDALDRNSYLQYMATQNRKINETPTNSVFGSFGFNPTGSTTQLAAWRQVVPSNDRRSRIIFSSLNQTLFFSGTEYKTSMDFLANWQINGAPSGEVEVMEWTFAAGTTLQMFTKDAIWVASLVASTPASAPIEQRCSISWEEEIYASTDADPRLVAQDGKHYNKPGLIEKLPASELPLVGDIRTKFSHDGVR